jgi:hypothetical protein
MTQGDGGLVSFLQNPTEPVTDKNENGARSKQRTPFPLAHILIRLILDSVICQACAHCFYIVID